VLRFGNMSHLLARGDSVTTPQPAGKSKFKISVDGVKLGFDKVHRLEVGDSLTISIPSTLVRREVDIIGEEGRIVRLVT
jgi:hypothetical protein